MPERVGFWPRTLALAVDASIGMLVAFLFGPWLGIRLGLGQYGGLGPGAGGMMAGALGGSALIALAYLASEAVGDATPGKRLLGLAVGTAEGCVAARSTRILRWALKTAPIALTLLAVAVGVGLPGLGGLLKLIANLCGLGIGGGCLLALGQTRQAFHDRVAGTAVYRRGELLPPQDDVDEDEDEAHEDDPDAGGGKDG